MKNSIKKITILISLVIFITSTHAQERNIIWVHGLNGSYSHWEHYKNIFDNERKINSVNRSYVTNSGIALATNDVYNDINTALSYTEQHNSKNMGIGHSLGGLILRNVDRIKSGNAQRIGGFITVNSPNYGAPIIESIQNGNVEAAKENACYKLADGPISQLFSLPWEVTNLTTSYICNLIETNDLIDDFGGSGSTSEDLLPNSTILSTINNYHSTLPRISIWGEETAPVHWKSLGTAIGYGDDDNELVNDMNLAREVYSIFYHTNMGLSIACGAAGFWFPPCWFQSAIAAYRATQWKKGRDWFDDSEDIWCSLIKTTRKEAHYYWVEVWVPCEYPPASPPLKGDSLKTDPDCGEWVWKEYVYYVTVVDPSDGILPKYTQVMKNNSTPNGTYRILGANHMEVLDMSNSTLNGMPNDGTRQRLNEIFSRPTYDWFYTPKK